MAQREPLKITLGDETYSVSPLTIAALEKIEVALSDGLAGIPKARAIICAALEKDHPAVAADIGNKPSTLAQMGENMSAVLRYAGFLTDAPLVVEPAVEAA